MNISLEKNDAVTAKLIVKLEKSDYINEVEKSLKKIKQKANMPGFRPGNVPMGLVKKMYGNEVKAEELNKMMSETVNNYIKEQNLKLILDPMLSDDQEKIDIATNDDFTFTFDLGFEPEINISLNAEDKIDYYMIEVDEKVLEAHIKNYQRQGGRYSEMEKYEDDSDIIYGTLTELDENNEAKEGGISLENVPLMPRYFADDASKEQFKNEAMTNADIVFNPSTAYKDNDAELASLLKIDKNQVAAHKGNFNYRVTSISHFEMGELNQELFDKIYGQDNVKNEEEFRARVKSDIETSYLRDSDYKFLIDLRKYAVEKVGDVTVPEALIKRFLLQKLKNEKDRENIDNILVDYIKDLIWSVIRKQLSIQQNIKIDDAAVKETAREMVKIQMAQYGINNIPEENLEQYAESMLKDESKLENIISRSIDSALTASLKNVVKLDFKPISVEDFNKMFEEN